MFKKKTENNNVNDLQVVNIDNNTPTNLSNEENDFGYNVLSSNLGIKNAFDDLAYNDTDYKFYKANGIESKDDLTNNSTLMLHLSYTNIIGMISEFKSDFVALVINELKSRNMMRYIKNQDQYLIDLKNYIFNNSIFDEHYIINHIYDRDGIVGDISVICAMLFDMYLYHFDHINYDQNEYILIKKLTSDIAFNVTNQLSMEMKGILNKIPV